MYRYTYISISRSFITFSFPPLYSESVFNFWLAQGTTFHSSSSLFKQLLFFSSSPQTYETSFIGIFKNIFLFAFVMMFSKHSPEMTMLLGLYLLWWPVFYVCYTLPFFLAICSPLYYIYIFNSLGEGLFFSPKFDSYYSKVLVHK